MKPLNLNTESCTPVSSNCVIWNGPNIDCIGLCKGATVTNVVYELASKFCNLLDQLSVSGFDIDCLNIEACPPETFKELIQLIINSICNIQVQNGIDGNNGNYTEVEAFAPGENDCDNGGVAIRTFDGVTQTQLTEFFICNSVDGEDGLQGIQGIRGDYVQIADATLGDCPNGGIVVTLISGEDDSTLTTEIICNGVDGADGADGANGTDGTNSEYVYISHTKSGDGSDLFYNITSWAKLKTIGGGQWDDMEFTAPFDGKYKIYLKLYIAPQEPAQTAIGVGLNGANPTTNFITGSDFVGFQFKSYDAPIETDWIDYTFMVDLTAGDVASLMIISIGGTTIGLLHGFLIVEKVKNL